MKFIEKVRPLIIVFLASISFNLIGQVIDNSSERGWLGLYYIHSMNRMDIKVKKDTTIISMNNNVILKDTTNILIYIDFISDSSIKIDDLESSEISEYSKEDKRIILKGSINDTFYLHSVSQERMLLLIPLKKTKYDKIVFFRPEPVKLNLRIDSVLSILTSKIWKLNSDLKKNQVIEFNESGDVYFNKNYKIRPNPTKWILKKIGESYFLKFENNYGKSYLKLISISDDSIEFRNMHSRKNVMYEAFNNR